jgi:hypothetical protein
MCTYEGEKRPTSILLILTAAAGMISCTSSDKPVATPPTSASPTSAPATERVVGPLTPADSQALSTMVDRINDYVKLSTKIQSTMPKLPAEASPQQIDKNQRELEKQMRAARASAKPGDIFTAEARPVIKRLIAAVFAEPDGKQLKDSVMDENPTELSAAKLVVNARYPDTVPLATIPPQVLQTLPKLTQDLEYRFIGDALILLDVRAHLIADFIEDVLPKHPGGR